MVLVGLEGKVSAFTVRVRYSYEGGDDYEGEAHRPSRDGESPRSRKLKNVCDFRPLMRRRTVWPMRHVRRHGMKYFLASHDFQ